MFEAKQNCDLIDIKDEPIDDGEYGVMDIQNGDILVENIKQDDEIKKEVETAFEDSEQVPLTIDTLTVFNAHRPKRTCKKKNTDEQDGPSTSKRYYAPKKYTGRKSLVLDELTRLSGKQLVQFFSEMSSNEITKNFAYTCFLMPETCSDFFYSFGNETKAKGEMQRHLLGHINELLEKKRNDPLFSFSAQTVLTKSPEEGSTNKKRGRAKDNKTSKQPALPPPSNNTRRSKNKTNDEEMKELLNTHLEIVDLSSIKTEGDDEIQTFNNLSVEVLNQSNQEIASNNSKKKRKKRKNPGGKDEDWNLNSSNIGKVRIVQPESQSPALVSSAATDGSADKSHEELEEGHSCDPTNPWCTDHSYDVMHWNNNKENTQGNCNDEVLDSKVHYCERPRQNYAPERLEAIDDQQLCRLRILLPPDENVNPSKLIIPILTVPLSSLPRDLSKLPNNPFEEFSEKDDDVELPPIYKNPRGTTAQNSEVTDQISNESEDAGEDDVELPPEEEIKYIQSLRGKWTDQQIKILARYYLKELKAKGKPVGLYCKICPSKKFTATATLNYHYKGHIGLKPYFCRKCGARFTRQHSLNYHNLTHQNISRFKCQYCDREFRHPSHFKEHTRRHTGETPFHCTDCTMKFKTRNTFKRHMRTRHGKEVPSMSNNRSSRIMSPTKINRAAISSPLTAATQTPAPPQSILPGTLENRGIHTSIINNSNTSLTSSNHGIFGPIATGTTGVGQGFSVIKIKQEPADSSLVVQRVSPITPVSNTYVLPQTVVVPANLRPVMKRTPRILQSRPLQKPQC